MSKRVLIISYYWPPSGGGGVQRWLKFAKFLPGYDWEPVIFTPENPDFELKDESLNKDVADSLEVIRFPIWEPFGVYKKLLGKSKQSNLKQGVVIEKAQMSFGEKLAIWVRGNMFFPDSRRFWVKPSVNYLTDYIERAQVDVVITTGPPHSMHLIGLGLKQRTGVKWICDFRDPWSDWDLLDKLKTSSLVKYMHTRLEKKVVDAADLVLTCTPNMRKLFSSKVPAHKVKMITNGVDPEDFDMQECIKPRGDVFRLTHMGLLNEMRNPDLLWEVLEDLLEEDTEFKDDLEIVLGGMVSSSIIDHLESSVLSNHVKFLDYLPHEKVLEHYDRSNVLLLLMNNTANADIMIPGKLFEYLYSAKDILAFGSNNSDTNQILESSGLKGVVSYTNKEEIKSRILQSYDDFNNGRFRAEVKDVDQWSRKNLTKELALLLDAL
ncbi:MAG: glycosyltransferase family 4 protein [Reichenbachiella sp.]